MLILMYCNLALATSGAALSIAVETGFIGWLCDKYDDFIYGPMEEL